MVMFRDFACRAALRFGLTGFVRNQSNDTVFVVAEGTQETLEQFITELYKGPMFARVDDIRVDWKKPTGEFSRFTINYA